MLDRFERQSVEAVRNHRGRISVTILEGTLDDEGTSITVGEADRRLNHDIALALQAYYQRRKQKRDNG